MTCYVYVMLSPGGVPLKVGMSNNPQYRLATLRTEFKRDLSLWKTWLLSDRDEAGKVEREAHKLLGEPAERREWFNATCDEAAAAIEAAIKNVRVTAVPENFFGLPNGWSRGADREMIERYQQARSAQIENAEIRLGRMMSRADIQQRQLEGTILP